MNYEKRDSRKNGKACITYHVKDLEDIPNELGQNTENIKLLIYNFLIDAIECLNEFDL